MAFDLRPHQEKALDLLKQSIRSGKRSPLLQAPCGFGKTIIAVKIVQGARAKGNRVCFCVPALSLVDQTLARFIENGVDPSELGVIQSDHPWRRPHAQIQIATAQTLTRRELPLTDIVVIDEAHLRFSIYDKWILDPNSGVKNFIALTATPWSVGLGRLFDDLIKPVSMRELIDAGYLSPFRVWAPSHPDLTGVKVVAGDYHEGQLEDAMNKPKLVADVVSTWMERGGNQPTLCFAVGRAHARALHDEFEVNGIPAAYVDANTPREEREEIGKRLAAGEIKVVCNIGTLTTGVDWDVRCLILARPTKSHALFCLDAETEILTSKGWKGIGQIANGDCVAACDGANNKSGRWSRVIATVERDMDQSEAWVEYDAPRANFRVTDRHRMIFEGAHEKGGFRIADALEMACRNGGVKMPTAVHIAAPGVPLTDDELYFIGMMMTDGTWTATGGNISQSERHPAIIERIEAALQGCGIGYAKRRILPQVESKIAERNPRWVFHFSAGKPKPYGALGRPRCGNEAKEPYTFVPGITGYRHLMPFMDKDFAPALMQLSRSQLVKLLEGIWDGDGSKKLGVDYSPKTMEICSARKTMVDRLQALCVINGMTATLRTENGASRKTPIYLLSIKDQDWRHCGGYTSTGRNGGVARPPRPQIEVRPATSERVWCVETEHGTIVTRRRGRVTVMGNCQIIGRALRTAPGKDHAVILDHSDTHLRLGMVTDIDFDELDGGRKRDAGPRKAKERLLPLPKACDACGCLVPPTMPECPSCGHVNKRATGVQKVDGELSELMSGGRRKKSEPATSVLQRMGKQSIWSQIVQLRRERSKSHGWASHLFRDIFSVWPRGLEDIPLDPTLELLSFVRSKNIAYAKAMQARKDRSAA